MTVQNVTTTGTSLWSTPATSAPKQTLDSEVFLSLLVTQLRSQDPSSPMDTNEMMAQTTQLASMEQLTALTSLQQEGFGLQMRTAAAALLGSEVSYLVDGKAVTGTATAVNFSSSTPTITVDGVEVALDAVSGVRSAAA
jgi:flagellar basal-body rod modification protein FlgD